MGHPWLAIHGPHFDGHARPTVHGPWMAIKVWPMNGYLVLSHDWKTIHGPDLDSHSRPMNGWPAWLSRLVPSIFVSPLLNGSRQGPLNLPKMGRPWLAIPGPDCVSHSRPMNGFPVMAYDCLSSQGESNGSWQGAFNWPKMGRPWLAIPGPHQDNHSWASDS